MKSYREMIVPHSSIVGKNSGRQSHWHRTRASWPTGSSSAPERPTRPRVRRGSPLEGLALLRRGSATGKDLSMRNRRRWLHRHQEHLSGQTLGNGDRLRGEQALLGRHAAQDHQLHGLRWKECEIITHFYRNLIVFKVVGGNSQWFSFHNYAMSRLTNSKIFFKMFRKSSNTSNRKFSTSVVCRRMCATIIRNQIISDASPERGQPDPRCTIDHGRSHLLCPPATLFHQESRKASRWKGQDHSRVWRRGTKHFLAESLLEGESTNSWRLQRASVQVKPIKISNKLQKIWCLNDHFSIDIVLVCFEKW